MREKQVTRSNKTEKLGNAQKYEIRSASPASLILFSIRCIDVYGLFQLKSLIYFLPDSNPILYNAVLSLIPLGISRPL